MSYCIILCCILVVCLWRFGGGRTFWPLWCLCVFLMPSPFYHCEKLFFVPVFALRCIHIHLYTHTIIGYTLVHCSHMRAHTHTHTHMQLDHLMHTALINKYAHTIVLRLPRHQDCHEMWSKKRRREKESKGDSAGSGKEDQSVVSSPPPSRPEPQKAPLVQPNPPTNQPAVPVIMPAALVDAALKPLLSVPLPSAPLTSSILDSLQSSLALDPAGVNVTAGMSLLGHNTALPGETVQTVVTHCDRSLKMQSPSLSLANRTQVFDYGNQSNKALECAAVKQLENDYRQDRW